jgi:hypothetical protein
MMMPELLTAHVVSHKGHYQGSPDDRDTFEQA